MPIETDRQGFRALTNLRRFRLNHIHVRSGALPKGDHRESQVVPSNRTGKALPRACLEGCVRTQHDRALLLQSC